MREAKRNNIKTLQTADSKQITYASKQELRNESGHRVIFSLAD